MVKSYIRNQAFVQRSQNDAGTNDGDSLVVKATKHNQKNSVETDQGQVYFLPIYQGFNFKSSSYLKTVLTQTSIIRVDRYNKAGTRVGREVASSRRSVSQGEAQKPARFSLTN